LTEASGAAKMIYAALVLLMLETASADLISPSASEAQQPKLVIDAI
jgi:hypothetical protein